MLLSRYFLLNYPTQARPSYGISSYGSDPMGIAIPGRYLIFKMRTRLANSYQRLGFSVNAISQAVKNRCAKYMSASSSILCHSTREAFAQSTLFTQHNIAKLVLSKKDKILRCSSSGIYKRSRIMLTFSAGSLPCIAIF